MADLEYAFTVAGKRVQLKQRLPLKDAADLPRRLGMMTPTDVEAALPIMRKLIESWEFDGDPSDERAWDNLDLFEVVWPLWRHIDLHLGERMKFDPKASARASSKPSRSGPP